MTSKHNKCNKIVIKRNRERLMFCFGWWRKDRCALSFSLYPEDLAHGNT